jgi:hypothetical protein
MSVSVICACKNRYDALRISLNSWLAFKEINEIIIVDWSSDVPINSLAKLDKRIKVVRVENEQFFNQPQPLNLAASLVKSKYILKLDCDYILNPYFSFFEHYKIDENLFLCGQDSYECKHEYWNENMGGYCVNLHAMDTSELIQYAYTYSPFFKYLTGLCYVTTENFWRVGGYDENMGKYYAFEDDHLTKRLTMSGLNCIKLDQGFNIIHLPHPDKKRYENFEGYGSISEDSNIENVKNMMADPNISNENRWNLEYLLAKMNVQKNEELFKDIKDYHVDRLYDWDIISIDDQNLCAVRKEKIQKLKNLPLVYYVSLEESVKRREKLEKSFREHGVTDIRSIVSKRFAESNDAITGKYIDQLNDGTKGCCVSHLKAIKEWYDTTEHEYGFFCEDDLSLNTLEYWNFSWNDLINNLPEDWECVQLMTIRGDFDTHTIRNRYWDDWSATAYIIKRSYAKFLIDSYIREDSYHLELENAEVMPLIENILFASGHKCYTIPLFVENIEFISTFDGDDIDVKHGQKRNHRFTHYYIINWWKNTGKNKTIEELMGKTFEVKKKEDVIDQNRDIDYLLNEYALDTENPIKNFNLGLWYEKERHNSAALSYFLRCAERTDDENLAYEALIHASNAYDNQGTRDQTAKGLLQQALCIMPKRPEAYYLLSRFSEKRQYWQDCYIYAKWGLDNCDFECEKLKTDVDYPGKYGLIFERSLASWSWGKGTECRTLLQDLKNNYDLDQYHYNEVETRLMQLGSGHIPEEIIKYQKQKHDKLKFKFPGSDVIEKNYSQAFQDLFILAATNGKTNGLYLEIGAQQPFYQNNTALLEMQYNWNGISIEILPELCSQFENERNNKIVCADATKINYTKLLDEFDKGTDFDYLQLDVEPSRVTFECLLAIPFERYRFGIITYEHDHYVDMSSSYRDKSRKYLKLMGYELLVANVSPNDNSPFEDWWYHPDLIDPTIVNKLKYVSDEPLNIVKYMFNS